MNDTNDTDRTDELISEAVQSELGIDTRTACELRKHNIELVKANTALSRTNAGLRRSLSQANSRAAEYQLKAAAGVAKLDRLMATLDAGSGIYEQLKGVRDGLIQ